MMKMRLLIAWLLFFFGSVQATELVELIPQVKPSVVGIAIHNPTASPRLQFIGTGFVVGNGKQVVTNYHVIGRALDESRREQYVVVSGSARDITIHPMTGRRNAPQYDLAIMEIEQALPALQLAGKDYYPEGSRIAFTGFPISNVLGLYPATHQGIIAAITPIAIPVDNSRDLHIQALRQLREPYLIYQLDATAYPGNSGSPLIHQASGQVIGVINMVHVKSTREAVLSDPSGISYAIPVRYVHQLLQTP
ncbi:MAG: trypsin-like peptidase domain-containing protein [Alkalimonas sp.]|nr:trypsin-like peptidase domain-containing protein [Alkalimonas sp.]